MTRDELIEALEKADGPSFDLDRAIAKLRNEELHVMHGWCPSFTASIDAALTLVPEGMCWSVERRDNYTCAKVFRYDWGLSGGPYDVSYGEESGHFREPSPAIALCIAALKVRGEKE